MNIRALLILLTIFFVVACSQSSSPPIEGEVENTYFSLKDFFRAEIEKLQSQQIVLHKYATLNGKEEKKALHEINWRTEFSPFLNSDINKPAWKESYRIDSSANNMGRFQVTYSALKPDLRTQEISIAFLKGETTPAYIDITNQSSNPIYDSVEKLQYTVDKSYLIENKQHIMWMNPDLFSIRGEMFFHKKKPIMNNE